MFDLIALKKELSDKLGTRLEASVKAMERLEAGLKEVRDTQTKLHDVEKEALTTMENLRKGLADLVTELRR